jgi:hypothetical protein
MTCGECTQYLLTCDTTTPMSDVAELHCRTCTSCAGVMRAILAGEAALAAALASARSSIHPAVIADRAILGARLRTMEYAFFALMIVALALAVVLTPPERGARVIEFLSGRRPLPNAPTETIALRCLTAEQGRDLVRPYLKEIGSNVVAHGNSLPAISVTGSQAERDAAKNVIRQFEAVRGSECR